MAPDAPWFQYPSAAAYAAEGVIRLLSPSEVFASKEVQKLFRLRSGFALKIPDRLRFSQTEEKKLIGALLSKIAQRGLPAPCSLALERQVLDAAQSARILDYQENNEGEFHFICQARIDNLPLMLKACLFPELLIKDGEVDLLINRYRSLCENSSERDFFDQLVGLLPERRLGLFVIPQRHFYHMLIANPNLTQSRVDFAIEIPYLEQEKWLKEVIEIDGPPHDEEAQKALDDQRDEAASQVGWQVRRFKLLEQENWEPELYHLVGRFKEALPANLLLAAKNLRGLSRTKRKAIENLVLLPIAEAQISAALGRLIHSGLTNTLKIGDPQNLGIDTVLSNITETVQSLARLHGVSELTNLELRLDNQNPDFQYFSSPANRAWQGIRQETQIISVPVIVSSGYVEPLYPARPKPVDINSLGQNEIRKNLEYFLQNIFRKVEFLEGQVKIIERALTLHPVIGLLPTAAGKSLCYQLTSLLQPGFTLVVDPLRSLMIDQEENLASMGIHRCLAIMSGREGIPADEQSLREEGYRSIVDGKQIFVFISPERLQIPDFQKKLKDFSQDRPISYCVVDEAHCVSEWGHDFRPAYLNVARRLKADCTYEGFQPSLMALTGTASRNVIFDIMQELDIADQEAVVEPKSFNRKELRFEVIQTSAGDRQAVLAGQLRNVLTEFGWRSAHPGKIPSGLIFTNFVNPDQVGVAHIRNQLQGNFPQLQIEIYAGGKPRGFPGNYSEWEKRKITIQRQFKRNQVPVLVCTQAFGMGIDKPDIRFTIHAMLPRSLEEFYQQSGRSGRDRQSARCIIIFTDDQAALADSILDTERTPFEEIQQGANHVPLTSRGDAIRNTWFLTQNFLGRDLEKKLLYHVLVNFISPRQPQHLGDMADFEIPFTALPVNLAGRDNDRETALEKAFYRLRLIGAIADYKKDYTERKFPVTLRAMDPKEIYQHLEYYLRRYAIESDMPRFLPKEIKSSFRDTAYDCGCSLIDFIYATVEKRRRRAIGEMLATARDAVSLGAESFRQQIMAYLGESEFTHPVTELSTRIEPQDWFKVLSKVTGIDSIVKLLGACRSRLVEIPDHPGLLLLAGLCRATSPNPAQGVQDVRGGFIALKRYLPPLKRLEVARQFLDYAQRLVPSRQMDVILAALLEADPLREFARMCYLKARYDSGAQLLSIQILAQELIKCINKTEGGHE